MIIDEFLDPLKHLLNQFTTLQEKVSFIHVYIIYTNRHPNIHNVPDKCVCLLINVLYMDMYTSENHLEKRLWLFISTS